MMLCFAHPRRVKVNKFAEAESLGPMRSWGLVVEKTLSNVEWSYAFGHYAWLITTRATPSLSVFAVLVTTSVNFLYNSPIVCLGAITQVPRYLELLAWIWTAWSQGSATDSHKPPASRRALAAYAGSLGQTVVFDGAV